MWRKLMRNMEWLLIVALLVGAVVAVGCTSTVDVIIEPYVSAGDDQTVLLGTTVKLTGSGTMNASAYAVDDIFTWSFTKVPDGSSLTDTVFGTDNASDMASMITFTPDVAGIYIIKLTLSNPDMTDPLTDSVSITVNPDPGGSTPAYVTSLQNELANNAFLTGYNMASLLEVFEFGPVGGNMTFTYLKPDWDTTGYFPSIRRTGTWTVADAGTYAQATETIGPRPLNYDEPISNTDTLLMPGYVSYPGTDTLLLRTWIKVAPVTVSNYSGKQVSSNKAFAPFPRYNFTADPVNRTGVYLADTSDTSGVPQSFTWMIVNGQKAVLTFADGSSHHLYLTVRDPGMSVLREMATVMFNSSGTVTGGSLLDWGWM